MAEPASSDEPLPFGQASALLAAFRSGLAGDDMIPDPPLLVVDLEGAPAAQHDATSPLLPPAHMPCVVVAIDRTGSRAAEGPPAAGADIYLTDAHDPPEPWVGSVDLDALTAAVRRNPQASATLVQVLRSQSRDTSRDLVTESLAYASLQAGGEHRSWLEANRGSKAADDDHGSPAVCVTRSGDTVELVLDRPARRNAYSARMRDELIDGLRLAAGDPTITAVHLRGNGPTFCSGGDLAEFGTVADAATAHQIRLRRSAAYHAHLVAGRLIASVHGSCVGAGVELPAFAGLVHAAAGTTFRLPEVGMGLIPGAGGTASIPRRIGSARTGWMALTGSALDAGTALRWGLVDSVAPGPPEG